MYRKRIKMFWWLNLIYVNGTQNKLFYEFENIMYILYCIMDIGHGYW